MSSYFDKQGNPLELMEWARLFSQPDYRRVALTTLRDGTKISTVWLGLNHAWGGGMPLIFETMVFLKDSKGDDKDQARYSTLAEAEAGHARMVEHWRKQTGGMMLSFTCALCPYTVKDPALLWEHAGGHNRQRLEDLEAREFAEAKRRAAQMGIILKRRG